MKLFLGWIELWQLKLVIAIFVNSMRIRKLILQRAHKKPLPSWHILVQSQQWKQQNNMWNLFKVTIKALQKHRSGIFDIKFEQISQTVLNKYQLGIDIAW